MSALGQKQTYAAHNGMSALPPIATSIAFFGMSGLGRDALPRQGESHRAPTNHGLRREKDRAYAPLRMPIMGSSDSSIPSVSWPGRNSNFFSAAALLGTTLSIVKTPRSATFRSFGQGFVGSFVGSPAAASCALR